MPAPKTTLADLTAPGSIWTPLDGDEHAKAVGRQPLKRALEQHGNPDLKLYKRAAKKHGDRWVVLPGKAMFFGATAAAKFLSEQPVGAITSRDAAATMPPDVAAPDASIDFVSVHRKPQPSKACRLLVRVPDGRNDAALDAPDSRVKARPSRAGELLARVPSGKNNAALDAPDSRVKERPRRLGQSLVRMPDGRNDAALDAPDSRVKEMPQRLVRMPDGRNDAALDAPDSRVKERPSAAGKLNPRNLAEKHRRQQAKVAASEDTRSELEQEAAADAMASDVTERLIGWRIKEDDIHYVGGAASRRAQLQQIDGVPYPASWVDDEIFRWARAQDSIIAIKETGKPPVAADFQRWLRERRIKIVVSRSDRYPHIEDWSEEIAQRRMLEDHAPQKAWRKEAAGTVAHGKGLEKDGYVTFGVLFEGARNDPLLCVARVEIHTAVDLDGKIIPMAERARAAAEAVARGLGQAASSSSAAPLYPDVVLLQRLTGLRSAWTSEVRGSVWERSWWVLGSEHCCSTVFDFGEGGERAARAMHAKAIKPKVDPSPSRRASRGVYEQLKPGQPFAPSRAELRALEAAADEAEDEEPELDEEEAEVMMSILEGGRGVDGA